LRSWIDLPKAAGRAFQRQGDRLGIPAVPRRARERLKTGSPVSMVVEFASFEFYGDFEAAKMDLKFGFGEYKHIHRAAFVGDQKWIAWFTRLIGTFTRTRKSIFPEGQIEAATIWACS